MTQVQEKTYFKCLGQRTESSCFETDEVTDVTGDGGDTTGVPLCEWPFSDDAILPAFSNSSGEAGCVSAAAIEGSDWFCGVA